MELLRVHEVNTLWNPNSGVDKLHTLVLNANDWRSAPSPTLVANVGPVAAGDYLDIRLMLQYSNDNTDAHSAGYWHVNGTKSEHWSFPVMGASSIRVNSTLDDAGAYVALPQHEENFDNYRHYMSINRSCYWRVPVDFPTNCYVWARSYFVASKSYVGTGRLLKIIGGYGMPRLQIGVLR